MKLITFALLLISWCLPISCSAQILTFIGSGTNSISSNQVAQIVSTKLSGPNEHLTITKGTNSASFSLSDFYYVSGANWPWPITIAGPATISWSAQFITLRISDIANTYTPSTSVVIPTDATGPVSIILESSADLVNWNSALPGTYGASATNRFFRVRAVQE